MSAPPGSGGLPFGGPSCQYHQLNPHPHLPPPQAILPPRPPPQAQPFAHRGPSRQGQPPSTRNFNQSSAGGASRVGTASPTTGLGRSPAQAQAGPGGAVVGKVGQSEEQEAKVKAWGESYVVSEESIRNDYSSHYVKTGERPQNNLRGSHVEHRFDEYPKLSSLLTLKHQLLDSPTHSIPPTFLATSDPMASVLSSLAPNRFDAILLSPPPEVTFDELRSLDLSRVAGSPAFVWLWVGSGQRGDGVGLEKGRELIAGWGYRRCEDIVWLKTNTTNPSADLSPSPSPTPTLFTPTLEHCLMGIRGTVRRSNDAWFAHCNVDTDVIVWEGDERDASLKPPELQSLVENFCQGTRRLHLWGARGSLRRGWLTVGEGFDEEEEAGREGGGRKVVRRVEREKREWEAVEFDAEKYRDWFAMHAGPQGAVNGADAGDGGLGTKDAPVKVGKLLPFVQELDALRPKSPPPRHGQASSGGLGRGRGAGLGVTRSGPALAASPSLGQLNSAQPLGAMGRGRGRGGPPLRPTPPVGYQPLNPYLPTGPPPAGYTNRAVSQPHHPPPFGFNPNPAPMQNGFARPPPPPPLPPPLQQQAYQQYQQPYPAQPAYQYQQQYQALNSAFQAVDLNGQGGYAGGPAYGANGVHGGAPNGQVEYGVAGGYGPVAGLGPGALSGGGYGGYGGGMGQGYGQGQKAQWPHGPQWQGF